MKGKMWLTRDQYVEEYSGKSFASSMVDLHVAKPKNTGQDRRIIYRSGLVTVCYKMFRRVTGMTIKGGEVKKVQVTVKEVK